jgi:hypothetical protein
VREDRPVAAVSRSFAFCLLAQEKHNMALAKARARIFRSILPTLMFWKHRVMVKKTAENLGFFAVFSLHDADDPV